MILLVSLLIIGIIATYSGKIAEKFKLPIIGVGGIMSESDAQDMIDAGASLVEIYSGFIYEGPALVKRIIKHLESNRK